MCPCLERRNRSAGLAAGQADRQQCREGAHHREQRVTGSGIARSSGTSTSSDNIVTIESSRSVCSLLRVRSLSSG